MVQRRYNARADFGRFGLVPGITPAVKWLLIVNGVVYLLELVIGRSPGGLDFIYYHLAISFDRFFAGELWQPVTYMFLHDPTGLSHILWNMLLLWMFGTPLERFWQSRGFMRFYLFTGIGAGLIVVLVAACVPAQRALPTLGASGALYALLVAFGFNYPNALIYLFGLFPIKGKHLVLLFVGLGLLQSLTLGASNVSVAAHLGGMFMGLVVVTGTWRPRRLAHYLHLAWMKWRYRRLKRKLRAIDPHREDRWMH